MFLQLPTEIKLNICASLQPEDILSLKQVNQKKLPVSFTLLNQYRRTCRGLHALGCLDYVWHQMIPNTFLPLALPPNQDIKAMTWVQLQPTVMKALQLERIWQGPPRLPRSIRRISHDGSVVAMHSFGPDWLAIAIESHGLARLCIHSANDDRCCHIAEFQALYEFCASLETASQAIIAVECVRPQMDKQLIIYSVALLHKSDRVAHIKHVITSTDVQGSILDARICGNIVAFRVRRSSGPDHYPSSSIILINTTTNARWSLPLVLSHLRIEYQLFPDRIAIIGSTLLSTLEVSVYSLPPTVAQGRAIAMSEGTTERDNMAALVLQHETIPLDVAYDFHTVKDPTYLVSGSAPIIAFSRGRERGHVLTFPMQGVSPIGRVRLDSFELRAKTVISAICVGSSGRRATWLEHRREFRSKRHLEEFELMKVSFSGEGAPHIQPLLPSDVVLPFELQNCVRMAFSEAGGHIYLSLITGELYAIDLI